MTDVTATAHPSVEEEEEPKIELSSPQANVLAVLKEIVNGQEKQSMDPHALTFEHKDEREEEREHELIHESLSRNYSSLDLQELAKNASTRSLLPRLAHARSADDNSVDYDDQENDAVVLNEKLLIDLGYSNKQASVKSESYVTNTSPTVEQKSSEDTEETEEDNHSDDACDDEEADDSSVVIFESDTFDSPEGKLSSDKVEEEESTFLGDIDDTTAPYVAIALKSSESDEGEVPVVTSEKTFEVDVEEDTNGCDVDETSLETEDKPEAQVITSRSDLDKVDDDNIGDMMKESFKTEDISNTGVSANEDDWTTGSMSESNLKADSEAGMTGDATSYLGEKTTVPVKIVEEIETPDPAITGDPEQCDLEQIAESKSFDVMVIEYDEPLPVPQNEGLVSRRRASLMESLRKDARRPRKKTSTNVAARSKKRASYGCPRDSSTFGSRYKKGMVTGLSLETQSTPQKEVIPDVAQCSPVPEVPSIATRKSPRHSHSHHSRSVLKRYNKELYYSNEFCYLLDLDPAEHSSTGGVAMDKVREMVEECPNLCRQKFDLTLDREVQHVYPLFSLVSHQAPLDIVKKVFEQNTFNLLEERDDQGQTLLHYACAFNPPSQETLSYIIHQTSKSLEAVDNKQRSPLHTACARLAAATDTVLAILKESPQQVLLSQDSLGFLPLSLALTNSKCTLKLVHSLLERNPEAVVFKTKQGDLPVDLAEKHGLSKDIMRFLLEKTPSDNIRREHLGLVLKNATRSSSLLIVKRLVEEDDSALTKGGSELPIRVAHNHNASKAVMKYLFEKTPKEKVPEWMMKLKPSEEDVKRAIKAEIEEETKQMADVVKPQSPVLNNDANVVAPTPSFWERLCCKPRV